LVSAKVVPPGGETQVKATVSTKNRRGHLKKTIRVTSNDPETPTLTLSLEAEIITDLTVTPYSINFGQLGKGKKAEQDVVIQSSDPKRIRIVSLDIEDKRFKIEPKSKQADGEHYRVHFLGSQAFERISAAITVKYQGADQTSMSIPMFVTVIGDLVYLKNFFFNKRDGAFSPREVNFSSRSSKPFKLISARDPANLLKLTIAEPNGPRAVLRAEVANPKASYATRKRGVVSVKTNRRDESRLEIMYTIMEPRAPSSHKRSTSPLTTKPVQTPEH
jgi:hypothetical protein